MNSSRGAVSVILFLTVVIAMLVLLIIRAEFRIDTLERRVTILMALTPGTQEKSVLARIPHRLDVRTYEAENMPQDFRSLAIPKGGHAVNFDSYEAETTMNAAMIDSIWVLFDKDGHCTGAYIEPSGGN